MYNYIFHSYEGNPYEKKKTKKEKEKNILHLSNKAMQAGVLKSQYQTTDKQIKNCICSFDLDHIYTFQNQFLIFIKIVYVQLQDIKE